MNATIISGFAGSFLLGGVSAWLLSRFMNKLRAGRVNETDTVHDQSVIDAFKKSNEFRLMRQAGFNKGFTRGVESTLKDFQVQYQKFENIEEKFFSSIVETGYFMQLTYKGLPIGDVTKRIIHAERKVDKKRVDEIIRRLDETVQALIVSAAAGKIPVKEVKDLLRRG